MVQWRAVWNRDAPAAIGMLAQRDEEPMRSVIEEVTGRLTTLADSEQSRVMERHFGGW